MALDPKARAARDEQELKAWEPMRAAGEQLHREQRQAEAVKQKEDGVQTTKEDRPRSLRAKV